MSGLAPRAADDARRILDQAARRLLDARTREVAKALSVGRLADDVDPVLRECAEKYLAGLSAAECFALHVEWIHEEAARRFEDEAA